MAHDIPNISDTDLVIFVGHSSDASAEAAAVKQLQSELQKELKHQTQLLPSSPFSSVVVWEWEYDAGANIGGQEVLIDPIIDRADFAIFVFKERVGIETWKELQKFRERQGKPRPIAACFPATVPHFERMTDATVVERWADLLNKKSVLTKNFGTENNTAVRPLPAYDDHEHLKRIISNQFKTDLSSIIKAALESRGSQERNASIFVSGSIFENLEQRPFDARPVIDSSIKDLDESILSSLIKQPLAQSKLLKVKETRSHFTVQLLHLGVLFEDNRPTVGLFICCALPISIAKKMFCELRLVYYGDKERAPSSPHIERESGNLLYLYDAGMKFLGERLSRTGNIGSKNRDDLEIPTRVLREALVNALIHREYGTVDARSQPTSIEIYSDRVEISSYGSLMAGIDIGEINERPESVKPIRRNEVISRIFAYFQHAELNASGIGRIHQDMTLRDLPRAEIKDKNGWVTVVLYRPLPEPSRLEKIQIEESRVHSRRPVVVISSTARDLPEHREQVRLACERAGFAPHEMMEYLTALDADAVENSLELVDRADVYIGIFAHRYGYVPDGSEVSITEMEYNRAVERGLPRLVFFIHKDHPITARDVESGPGAARLEVLKDRIGREQVAAFFRSPGDLRGHVVEALIKLREKLEPKGREEAKLHRRTAVPEPPKPYVAHPYTLLQTRGLIGRQAELNALTDWVANPGSRAHDLPICCFAAIGGMGKSALTWKWFNDIAPNEMKPLAGRLWWSFYESDASFENFLSRALLYISDLGEGEVKELSWQEREDRLLRQLDERPFLLVFDGLERILNAYNRVDASRLADDEYEEQTREHYLRKTVDPRAGRCLHRLAQVRASKVLISTRLYPSELQTPSGTPLPGCLAFFLRGLGKDDALALWRTLGVSGSRAELGPIFDSVERHPLLVQVLASEIAQYRKAPGDFAQWRADHPGFEPTTLPLVQSRTHILQFALQGLGGASLEVLRSVVAFRMPATYDSLEALHVGEGKACAGAKDLDRALAELEDRGLIGWDRAANRYDAHPIVRGVVWQQTSSPDQQALYQSLEAHLEPMATPDFDHVESLDDLAPTIERFHNLVGLGRYDDAFRLFRDRLSSASLYRLAAHRQRIAWLDGLFPEGLHRQPVISNMRHQSYALDTLALSYKCIGQPASAIRLYERAAEIDKRLNDKQNLSVTLSNLALARLAGGGLREAAAALWLSLSLSREDERTDQEGERLHDLGRLLSTAGDDTTGSVAQKRGLQIADSLGRHQVAGVAYAYLAEQALQVDGFARGRNLADHACQLAHVQRFELDFIHAALLQGRAALGLGDLDAADERLHHALTRAKAVNVVEFELPALVAIAELELKRDRPESARALLDEVWEPAERGPYPLYRADAYNVLATIERQVGNQDAAVKAATDAYRAAWCDGPPWAYHWGLETAKAHLQALGAPEPDLPPFDEAKFEPLPDVELNPKDDYWVDPDDPNDGLPPELITPPS